MSDMFSKMNPAKNLDFSSGLAKKLIVLTITTAVFLFLFTSCSGVDYGALGEEQIEVDQFSGGKPGTGQGEYVEGELIVSLETGRQLRDLCVSESSGVIRAAVNEQKDVLADTEFTLNNLFISDQQGLPSEQSGKIYSDISLSLLQDIVSRLGYLNLVTFSQEEYEDIFQAAEELESVLTEAGMEVNYIEPNYLVQTAASQQPTAEQKWHYEMINAPQAWERETGSHDIHIAVLDTGIDYEHQALKKFVREDLGKNYSELDISRGRYLNKEDVRDEHGHGTHVAGTIVSSGRVSGVMKEATLIPVKVLDGLGSGQIADVAKGIAYAVDAGADIINLSLGGGYSDLLEEKANFARHEKNRLVVAAAGNTGDSEVLFPARFDSVLAVGGLTEQKNRAEFSNYGSSLDVMAPGVNIFSTLSSTYNMDIDRDNVVEIDGYNYAYMTGTSMAAPHAAGMAGLIKSFEPDISVDALENLIKESAHGLGRSYEYGEGLIDAYRGVGGRITEPYF